ncbi:lysophospholipid acyltransferase family protein [Actinoplanes sp. NPDC051494]|uniref:lysophospholipid acyltransferase family protein n=1 Tax=Actinoplanes sp. NPDC051494 TaxID=3363907 RepID=UPI0037B90F2D
MGRRKLGFWRRLSVWLVVPTLWILTRRTWRGIENVPAGGGVIITPNHMSQFDPLPVAYYVYRAGRWPRFLAKASIWKIPVIGFLLTRTWQIPVVRGSVEAARSLDTLVDAIHQGAAVIIYPEGTTTRDPDLWPMTGKTGAARLALVTGAPVIPMATWGTQGIHDVRTNKVSLRPRRPISVAAGKPVDLSRWLGHAPSRTVLAQMTEAIQLAGRDLLADLRDEPAPAAFYSLPTRRADGASGTTSETEQPA